MSRSRSWLVVCALALLVFAAPLLVAGAITDPDPEIRLIRTGDRISALVVTDRDRVLIINSDDRGETRSAIGQLARPWEPAPTTLVAPPDDRAASGLWEAMQHPDVNQVIVTGLPGRAPVWSSIEKDVEQRSLQLQYIHTLSQIDLSDARLIIDPKNSTIIVQRGEVLVSISVGQSVPVSRSTVAVINDSPEGSIDADLIVTLTPIDEAGEIPVVIVRDREATRLVLEDDGVRIRGGRIAKAAP